MLPGGPPHILVAASVTVAELIIPIGLNLRCRTPVPPPRQVRVKEGRRTVATNLERTTVRNNE